MICMTSGWAGAAGAGAESFAMSAILGWCVVNCRRWREERIGVQVLELREQASWHDRVLDVRKTAETSVCPVLGAQEICMEYTQVYLVLST